MAVRRACHLCHSVACNSSGCTKFQEGFFVLFRRTVHLLAVITIKTLAACGSGAGVHTSARNVGAAVSKVQGVRKVTSSRVHTEVLQNLFARETWRRELPHSRTNKAVCYVQYHVFRLLMCDHQGNSSYTGLGINLLAPELFFLF